MDAMNRKTTLFLSLTLLFALTLWAQEKQQRINGRIYDVNEPLEGTTILVKGTQKGTTTDENGYYTLYVKPGDLVVYKYFGFKDAMYVVEDHSRVVNINMIPNVEQLDEVVVTSRKSRQKKYREEYATNKNLIHTYFGILNKETSTFALRVIDGEDLFVGGDILSAIQSHVPGIRVVRPLVSMGRPQNIGSSFSNRDPNAPVVFLPRSFNSLKNPRPAIFEVDGVIFEDAPLFLNPANIDRVAVINSSIGTLRYGQIGAGGVIVINTTYGPFASGRVSFQGKDRDPDNLFDAKNLELVQASPRNKNVELLYTAGTREEAEKLLSAQMMMENTTAFVNIEIADYFLETWQDRDRFKELYTRISKKYDSNATILKALAYRYEEEGFLEETRDLYHKIFLLRPSYGQSYIDLAHAEARLGDEDRAAELLARYIRYKDLNEKKGTVGIDSIIKAEFRYYLGADVHDLIEKPADDLAGTTRFYFEWNNGDAEFQIQFVNPEGRFFDWDHTYEASFDQILKEKQLGYSSAHFVIDENLPGKWMVNIKYKGNKSYNPTYIKSTVYNHYNTPNEKKVTYVHRLTEKGIVLNLLELAHNPVYRNISP